MYINMENISQIAVSNDLSEEEYIATLTDEDKIITLKVLDI